MPDHRPRAREAVIGAVVGALLLACSIAVVVVIHEGREDRADLVRARDLAVAVGSFDSDLSAVVEIARTLAQRIGAAGGFVPALASSASPLVSAIGFCTVTNGAFTVEGVPVAPATMETASATLDLARDNAQQRALPPLPATGGGEVSLIAAPAYTSAGGPPASQTTDQRRARLLGYVLVEVDLEQISTAASRSGNTVVVRASGPSGLTATHGIETTVTAAGLAWTVSVVGEGVSGVSLGELTTVAAGIIMAVGAVLAGAVTGRRRVAAESAAASALSQLNLMTSLAPVVQESVEIAQVLPEIAIRLRDELELAGIGFALPAAKGSFRDLYVTGSIDGTAQPSTLMRPLAAGESAAIVLHRGGRTIGALKLRAGRALELDELEALRGAAELATAAIASGRLFEQQELAIRSLRDVDELKTAFLGTVSHELRTPVTAIKGFAELLASSIDQTADSNYQLYTARIRANADSLDTLVQDLLDFSRLERRRLVVARVPVDLASVAGEVMSRLSVILANHQLTLDLEPTPVVLGDRDAIERILTNLVSNAARYSPPGTTVTVRTRPSDGGAELVVDDEGPGVPLDDREKVFARFFRGTTDEVIRTRGTGIGLAVVKEYVDQLGGRVSVDSSPSGGARFRVWFAGETTQENA